ncbi:CGNR zinc finger domain-containing protein [Ruegeria sp. R13_0]|uniref:CGNR zinc finger domain-containing protein n=1 Tax=Ruegeria sp. R13_0 TaxID=2821099 RepID=UPI001AD9ADD6|nr:CGNR zinc finger domain-containing protein [Ruegeria sp. R13_0]MBO9436404.1 CGNR zinc finger domain-containing protein [Ruegeria sp. R13_0]
MWSDDSFVGGHLALDFLNTVGDTDKSRAKNLITSPDVLMDWVAASGLEDSDAIGIPPSQKDLETLIGFRELSHRVLSASLDNNTTEPDDIRTFETQIKCSMARAHLDLGTTPARWIATCSDSHYWIDRFVLLVERFLSSPEVAKLRQCEGCSWFFLNSGRGRGRRWCNMSTCGNRHKVAAYRKRILEEDRK